MTKLTIIKIIGALVIILLVSLKSSRNDYDNGYAVRDNNGNNSN